MAMQQGEDLAVSTSARQRWRLPGLAAIMTAGSAALIITQTDGGLDIAVGLLGLAFFGPITLWSLLRAISPQPALILSADGFTDRATATGAGFVPWPEVQRIDARLFMGRVTGDGHGERPGGLPPPPAGRAAAATADQPESRPR